MFFNSRFEVLFGGSGLRGRGLKVWGIFRDPEILQVFRSALEEGKAGSTKVIPLDQDGSLRRYLSLSVAPLRKQGGVIYGAVGIFHDVTELKSAEQMRIDFVANVSHELRTPLTVIKGFADTLIEDFKKQGGPTLDYLYSIARNSDRLMALMNDLLDLSSIESSGVVQKDALDTQDLTERVLQQLQPQFAEKQQNVRVDCQAPVVLADAHRAEQVLVNLLTNSNKYTPVTGNIVVTWESDGGDVLLRVSNDGPAIPLEHQARLFERFYRIDKHRSREKGGTGLGLAIVKHIMQQHGGNVWVESNPPQSGAAFVCRFPAQNDVAVTPR
jgi:two-component system phosphate regulon sensor histidine kinase PhoR